jgi:hypothetical protein
MKSSAPQRGPSRKCKNFRRKYSKLLRAYLIKSVILMGFPVSWPYGLIWAGGAAAIYRIITLYFDVQTERWSIGTHEVYEPWLGLLFGVFLRFFPFMIFRRYESP